MNVRHYFFILVNLFQWVMGSSTSNVTNVNDDGGLLSFSIQKPMYEDEITKDVTKGSFTVDPHIMDETPPEVAPFDPSDPGFVLKNMLQTSGRESRRLPNLCLQGVRCLNGGNCIPEAGKFFCDCPTSHYGKSCEFVADKTNCDGHICANNASCYSIDEERTVIRGNANFSGGGNNTFEQIQYACWCRYKTTGEFCELSTDMLECSKDHCNYHGIINSTQNGTKCVCQCEEFYSGERCEIIDRCRDVECYNGGICNKQTLECECPKNANVSIVDHVEVKGKKCEIIEGRIREKKAKNPEFQNCFPCNKNSSLLKYVRCMQAEFGEFARIHNITEDDPTALLANGQTKWNKTKEYPASLFWEAFIEDYRDPVTHVGPPSERGREFANCFLVENTTTCFEALNRSFCVNNGQCYAAIDQYTFFDYNVLIPKCECPKGFEGSFCQRKNGCAEMEETLGANLCVENQGDCYVDTDSLPKCNCTKGFKGDRCEFNDPCALNPCGKNEVCIEYPVINDEDSTYASGNLTYSCECVGLDTNGKCLPKNGPYDYETNN